MDVGGDVWVCLAPDLNRLNFKVLADLGNRLGVASRTCGNSQNQPMCGPRTTDLDLGIRIAPGAEVSLSDVDVRISADRAVRLVECDVRDPV